MMSSFILDLLSGGRAIKIDDEIAYLVERERIERLASENAACAEAREAHLQMAERYADRRWSVTERLHDATND